MAYNFYNGLSGLDTNPTLASTNWFNAGDYGYSNAMGDVAKAGNGTNWGGIIGGIGTAMSGLSGLAGAYLGMKNLELARDQYKFQKGLANRNLANQAKVINNTYDNAAQVAAGLSTGGFTFDSNGKTQHLERDQNVIRDYEQSARNKHVDGSAI